MDKPKQVKVELISPFAVPMAEPYVLLAEVRQSYHKDTQEAKIALAWRKDTKADSDGHLVLGRCVKASELQKELVDWDFVILLNHEVWTEEKFDVQKKRALLDHELCHIDTSEGEDGHKTDSKGRKLWRLRKHDIEEFHSVVAHHGCYKSDLERFAEVLLKAKAPTLFSKEEEKTASVQ